uniref:Uncharacterized protein n=1 Tax=Amphora coffeiformis TaxID=265554 RepID=A0A7S3P649_9STRA
MGDLLGSVALYPHAIPMSWCKQHITHAFTDMLLTSPERFVWCLLEQLMDKNLQLAHFGVKQSIFEFQYLYQFNTFFNILFNDHIADIYSLPQLKRMSKLVPK